jgi:hypothetical protein
MSDQPQNHRVLSTVNAQRTEIRRVKSRSRGWVAATRLLILVVFFGGFWLITLVPDYLERAGFNLVPVTGRVTLDGQAPNSARLVFIPLEKNFELGLQPISVATTGRNGEFRLRTLAGKPGAARGRHLVLLLAAPEPPNQAAEVPNAVPDEKKSTSAPSIEPPDLDAWRNASDLLGYWVSPVPIREETTIPFFGIHSLEIDFEKTDVTGPHD